MTRIKNNFAADEDKPYVYGVLKMYKQTQHEKQLVNIQAGLSYC